MNDLRSKVQRRIKDAPDKTAGEILRSERGDMRRTTVYLPTESVRSLKRLAADEDTTMTALINEGVDTILKRGTN